MRAFSYGAALALAVGFAALAQTSAAQQVTPPPSAGAPPASDATATATAFKAGMVVKDSAGATVGKIARVGKTAEGTAAVEVNVDGKTVNLAASTLTLSPSGTEAVSSMTKAEIKATPKSPS